MEHLGKINFHNRPEYNSEGLITCGEVNTISGSLLTNVVEDLTPQLGGDLDLQTNKITGEGGTEGIYIDSDGKVGVGTTSPDYKLDVRSDGVDSQVHISHDSNDDGGYFSSITGESLYISNGTAYQSGQWIAKAADSTVLGATGDDLYWYSASDKVIGSNISLQLNMILRSSGLTVQNPSAPVLALKSGYDSHYGIIEWRQNSGSTRGAFMGWGVPGQYLQLKMENGNDFVITDCNVGIGTTDPRRKLEVEDAVIGDGSSTDTYGSVSVINSSDGNSLPAMLIKNEGTATGTSTGIAFLNTTASITSSNNISNGIQSYRGTVNRLGFLVGNTPWASLNEAMSIVNNGDVGIGTTTPTEKLDIDSDAIRVRTAKTITNSTDTGNQGDMCWDSNYMYVCVATNTWKRAALSTW